MAFFEDLGKKISETSSGVVKKTKDTAEVVKLSATLAEEEKNLAKAYSQLGEAYLNAHPEDFDKELLSFVTEVKENIEKVEKYKAEIYRLKGFIPCQNCGNMVSEDTVFCTSCGARMQPEEVIASQGAVCQNCGNALGENALFCTACGTKVEEKPAVAPEAQPAENSNVCKNCGNALKEGALFCTACGTKVEEEPQIVSAPEVVAEPEIAAEPEVVAEPAVVEEPVVEPVEAVQENSDLCKNCGSVLKEGALFCTSCGARKEVLAAEPKAVTVENENTGFQIKNLCSNCGKELPFEAKFCTSCGTPVQ